MRLALWDNTEMSVGRETEQAQARVSEKRADEVCGKDREIVVGEQEFGEVWQQRQVVR